MSTEGTEDFWEKMLLRGLDLVFSRKEYEDTKNIVLKECPDILQDNLLNLNESTQYSILSGILSSNEDLLDEDFWDSYTKKAFDKAMQSTEPSFFVGNSRWIILLNELRMKKEKLSWFPVLEKISLSQKTSKEILSAFYPVLEKCISEDDKNLINIVYKTDIKSYPKDLRLDLYEKVISCGKLDVKIARRIRSDSSGDMSKKALRVLFEHKGLYPNDDFQNLITQFSDTKHPWVAQYIALNMPTSLTPFLIGLDDPVALKIVEMRMNNV